METKVAAKETGPGGEPGHEYTGPHAAALANRRAERLVFFEFAFCHQLFRLPTAAAGSRLADT